MPTATCDCRCGKKCTAALTDALAMLSLCKPCFDARYAAGLKAMDAAAVKEKRDV